MQYDVIIIGAGAAGLMATRHLSFKGYKCCVLEASARAGGRIHSLENKGFKDTAEAGAEFIHGNLSLTISLLKQAGIAYEETGNKMINVKQGVWLAESEEDEDWEALMEMLTRQVEDITVDAFLDLYFADERYTLLRKNVRRFAEGYDLADPIKASLLSLKEEWAQQDEKQFRVKGGYIQLVNYFLTQCIQQGTTFSYHQLCTQVRHGDSSVSIFTADKVYHAKSVIVTVSLGVLQSGQPAFFPVLPLVEEKINLIGFGAVIKFLLEFNDAFWQEKMNDANFILSDEEVPTWWTQTQKDSRLLTGWLGGPKAKALATLREEDLLQIALISLANLFALPVESIQSKLTAKEIVCWNENEFVKGGYSYNMPGSISAKAALQNINNIIFFAGEAFYEGKSKGTVEAALQSGLDAAKAICKIL